MKLELEKLFGSIPVKVRKVSGGRRKSSEWKIVPGLEACSYRTHRHSNHKGFNCSHGGPKGLVCTRRHGHAGKHHAMGMNQCQGEWY